MIRRFPPSLSSQLAKGLEMYKSLKKHISFVLFITAIITLFSLSKPYPGYNQPDQTLLPEITKLESAKIVNKDPVTIILMVFGDNGVMIDGRAKTLTMYFPGNTRVYSLENEQGYYFVTKDSEIVYLHKIDVIENNVYLSTPLTPNCKIHTERNSWRLAQMHDCTSAKGMIYNFFPEKFVSLPTH